MALLGHQSARMSLRYGRLFDTTVRADYQRALELAKSRLGPVLPEQRTTLPLTDITPGDWRRAADQGAPRRWLLPAHPGSRCLPLHQHLRTLPQLPQ